MTEDGAVELLPVLQRPGCWAESRTWGLLAGLEGCPLLLQAAGLGLSHQVQKELGLQGEQGGRAGPQGWGKEWDGSETQRSQEREDRVQVRTG